jgi:hypothetical protein
LSAVPGISQLSAEVIVGEIGIDMGRFPSQGHLISWAGLCPKNDESAGKRRSTRMRKGAPWLKTTLIICAWAAVRTKGSYLKAQFHRRRSRRGAKKAIGAIAPSILTAAYHYAEERYSLSGFGRRLFRSPGKSEASAALGQPASEPRLRHPNYTFADTCMTRLFLVKTMN